MRDGQVLLGPLLLNQTATGVGAVCGPCQVGEKSIQAHVAGTGAVSATVKIQVSNNPSLQSSWIEAGAITLTGTTTAVDGLVLSNSMWGYYRAEVTAISGTAATVNVMVGQ